MTVLTIDFETYFSIQVPDATPEQKKSGHQQFKKYSVVNSLTTEEYVRDPRFECIGVGVGIDGEYQWMEGHEFAALAKTLPWHEVTVRHHHAHFDGLILSHHYGVRPMAFQDTLAMGRVLHGTEVGNSLGSLARFYGAGEKGDDTKWAVGKHRRDFSKEQWAQYGRYCLQDCALTDRIFDAMMAQGFPASELPIIDLTVQMFTDPQLVLDRPKAQAFVEQERANKAALMARCGVKDRGDLLSNEKMALLLQSAGVDPPMKWSEKKGRMDFAFAKSDPEFAALKDHDDVGDLVKARLGVKSTINETRTERFLRMDSRGKLCVYIRNSGTHTHRWSGAEKMNWQNLERVGKGGKGTLRKCLLAPPGKMLVVADSNQIEARVLAWLCGQQDVVDEFARPGSDIYSKDASRIYRRHVDGKNVDADKPLRAVGKIVRLALGFQMGFVNFSRQTIAGPSVNGGTPIIFTEKDAVDMGVDVAGFLKSDKMIRLDEIPTTMSKDKLAIHTAVCDYLVSDYRKASPKIVEFWYDVCFALMASMLNGDEEQCGPIRTKKDGLVLPNGLVLRYPDLKRHENPRGVEHTYWKAHSAKAGYRSRMYGGLLTENIVQALARVIVTDQLNLMYERSFIGRGAPWKVVTTTHDEVVLCVPENDAEYAAEVLEAIMSMAPDWAEGLPVAAGCGFAKVYGEVDK